MAVTAGVLSQVSVGSVGDSLSATTATGGTTPYSYQWYRSTITAFTPGSASSISGATALTLNDSGLLPGSQYYYKMVVTDSAGTPASATYAQLGVLTQGQNVLSLSNVINIAVSQAQAGLGALNTSNLAVFTHELPANSFGSLGYKIYLSPQQVALDFGTSSTTYTMALAIFGQNPNILANSGYLVIIPFLPSVVNIALSGVAASGTFTVSYGGNTSAAIQWSSSATVIQTALQLVSGLSSVQVSGSIASQSLNLTLNGIYSPTAITVASSLLTGGSSSITATVTIPTAYESLNAAIVRTTGLIQYFGIMGTVIFPQADMLAAAATVQAQYNLAFFVSNNNLDVLSSGMLYALFSNTYTQSRGLYYGGTPLQALTFMAAYAGFGLSVNFQGSNTTLTMHLKTLSGVSADLSMNQTLLNQCQTAGVDVYANFGGVSKVFTSGANVFYDDIYNLLWFVTTLEVSGFNYLATTSTKIPQTEFGMTGLKGAYRQVCQQAVANQFLAPGTWTSSTTFGNITDFYNNISNVGYYIYSTPISQQSPTVRLTRAAPLVQIAAKRAGAVHSSNVVIFVN